MNNDLCPILKWAGGKRRLLSKIGPLIPSTYKTYYEPFIGGGALLFDQQPKNAVIGDINPELINLYKTIKDFPNELIKLLTEYSENNSSKFFLDIRSQDRQASFEKLDSLSKAARTIYLNKTCFNGLYRVNSDGYFNTPFGKYKTPNIINAEGILAVSNYFRKNNIEMICGNYEKTLKNIGLNDFVYLDPPYDPISETASFTGYSKEGFTKKMQEELATYCKSLNDKKVKFLLSNSNTEFIRSLYKDYDISIIEVKRNISADLKTRRNVEEVLVKNY